MPCCMAENGCEDEISTSSSHEDDKDDTCSPFFACAGCAGFVARAKALQLPELPAEKHVHYQKMEEYHTTSYDANYWQPPRPC